MIDKVILAEALADSNTKWQIECVNEIDSTNDELGRRFGNSKTAPGLILWAEEQHSGRGRLNRKWFSVAGLDITASVLFPSPVHTSDIPKLSLVAGLALVDILKSEHNVHAMVRWPNDVITENGKLAGILSTYLSTPDAVICGIGINVNSLPVALPPVPKRTSTTMLSELGHEVRRENMLASWVLEFENLWELARRDRIDDLRRAFDAVSFYRNRRVKVLIDAGSYRDKNIEPDEIEGIAGSLDDSGALLINLDSENLYPVSMEDVLIPI